MMINDCCPRCRLVISADRLNLNPVVCNHCGWVLSGQEQKLDQGLKGHFRNFSILVSVALVASFIHLVTWDSYFVEVIPLKTQQMLGLSSTADMIRLAEICESRKNPDCSESALNAAVRRQPDDLKLVARLGDLRYKMGLYERAIETFKTYFDRGGRAPEAAFRLAKALQQMGRIEEAAQYFDYILESKEEALQITVTQNYISMLRESGQFSRAIEVIESIRKRGSNAAFFLDAELQDLKKRVKGSAKAAS